MKAKLRRAISLLACSAMLSLSAVVPALAQTTQEGLVNVNVEDVIIQAPIGVVANVCGIDANVLAKQKDAPVDCDATLDQFPVAFTR